MTVIKKLKRQKKVRTIEDVLGCTKKCTGFPYGCLDCSKELIWKK